MSKAEIVCVHQLDLQTELEACIDCDTVLFKGLDLCHQVSEAMNCFSLLNNHLLFFVSSSIQIMILGYLLYFGDKTNKNQTCCSLFFFFFPLEVSIFVVFAIQANKENKEPLRMLRHLQRFYILLENSGGALEEYEEGFMFNLFSHFPKGLVMYRPGCPSCCGTAYTQNKTHLLLFVWGCRAF